MLDPMARRTSQDIAADLRARLEIARLDLLALFRALDRMNLTPQQIPQRLLRQLFELDADYAEALWGLDQPPGKLNMAAMLRDTQAALDQLPAACSRFRKTLPLQAHAPLSRLELTIRSKLNPAEAIIWSPVETPQTVKHPSQVPQNQPAGPHAILNRHLSPEAHLENRLCQLRLPQKSGR